MRVPVRLRLQVRAALACVPQHDSLPAILTDCVCRAHADDRKCVVCLEGEADHAVLFCMHMCLCGGCAAEYVGGKAKDKSCPMCRGSVETVKKVFG